MISQLPVQLTSFVGRGADLAEILALALRSRLVTLIGPGGVGKTRLAIEVARLLHESEVEIESVYFLDLAPLQEPGLLEPTLITTLGGRQDEGASLETIIGLLGSSRPLLLIDNCEHLVDPVARLVNKLLRHHHGICILATSREPLRVGSEARWLVSPLDDEDGVRLFVERAHLIDAKAVATDQDKSTLVRLCRELDGLPLAIELAAARIGQVPVGEIIARLDDRFALLSEGDRTASARHSSLEAAIAWSYELLDQRHKEVFACLSVFAGDFDSTAAEAVANCTIDELGRLIDKSMIVVSVGVHGRARYRLLETLRQYGSERIDESRESALAGGRHFRYFAALAAKAAPELRGRHEPFWLERLTEEHANLRGALEWGLVQDPNGALGMAVDLIWFWHRRGLAAEGRSWLQRLVSVAPSPRPETLAAALTQAGDFAHQIGERDIAVVELGHALQVWRRIGDPAGISRTLVVMVGAASRTDADWVERRPLLDEALSHARTAGDDHLIIEALSFLGIALSMGRNDTEGRARQNQAEALARRNGDFESQAWAIWLDAAAFKRQGDLVRARARFEEGLEVYRSTGMPLHTTMPHVSLGALRLAQNDEAGARQYFETALTFEGVALPDPLAIEGLAVLAARRRGFERALKLLGAASSMPWWWTRVELPKIEIRRCVGAARGALGRKAADAAWRAGAAMTTSQAIAYALSDGDEPRADEGPLTGREKEIATLVAGGLRNREIAERLQISPRTVDAHVEHIRDKLGYRSRAQVAGWAMEHGFVKS